MALGAVALFGVLALPGRPSQLVPGAIWVVPLELPALLGMMLALGAWPRIARVVALCLVALLTLLTALKVADLVTYEAFSRPFNPVVDLFMFPAAMNLLTGSLGRPLALVVAVLAGLAVGLTGWLIYRALRAWCLPSARPGARIAASVVALFALGWTALASGQTVGLTARDLDPPGDAMTTRLALAQARRGADAARKLAAYRVAAAQDPYARGETLFDLLEGRDVVIVFVESYGRTSFDNPLYRPTHVPTLQAAEDALRDSGLAMASGWLTAPIAGGQSWLAHGTLASGLATADQARYAAMLASPRQTLFHLARGAGYRTAAVMPAITLPWPEGPMLGFETILDAADLHYAGQPFNWVTMPDQYTLDAYPDLLGDDPRPDFLQIALISSHAPWVPVPQMVDWARVGDGRIFDRWATSGDPPRVVWKDRDRVRDQYRQAIDYALQAAFSFAARQGGANAPLMIVLGDHPPAAFVSQIDGKDVPVHIIGPPEVLARLDAWGLKEGLVPDETAPVWPMEDFRDRFITAYTSTLAAQDGT
ncbi:sulfatase-like hydrolase/transferase [Pseudooceanicola algae]|uniref:Sulfatase N-terminal domain-containing protein n=1 Tax=Pseudooceanicola algae TaxID=1537215 RepID=A0A418SCA5_9RHOB|nr:sulfatase-like hydrolase/transferase [Pseudooceanicola algae]QPM89945.1 hypothetical protein PSAL_011750 [Pseudooceanicola algae]